MRRPTRASVFALFFTLAFPSLYVIDRFVGCGFVVPYVALAGAAATMWQSRWRDDAMAALGERRSRWLLLATMASIVGLVILIYPLANSGRFGRGSDSDEALIHATSELLHGRFPFLDCTYLGGPITPMPGELILAAPFVLVGMGPYFSLFWVMAVVFLLHRMWAGDSARTVLFCWLVLAGCPAVVHSLCIGSDYPANALMVLVFSVMLMASAEDEKHRRLVPVLWAFLFGVSLSSRANFLFVVPLVASRLVQTRGARAGLALTVVALCAAGAVTVPFLLHDSAHFSPWHTRNKLIEVERTLPHALALIPSAAGVMAVVLSRPRWNATIADFLRNAAATQAVLVTTRAIAWWVGGRQPTFNPTTFGQFFLYFALGASALRDRPLTAPRLESHGTADAPAVPA